MPSSQPKRVRVALEIAKLGGMHPHAGKGKGRKGKGYVMDDGEEEACYIFEATQQMKWQQSGWNFLRYS